MGESLQFGVFFPLKVCFSGSKKAQPYPAFFKGLNSCSTAVDIRNWKSLVNQGIHLTSQNGVVPTKSGGRFDRFYLFRKNYLQFFKYLTLNIRHFCVL